MFIINSTDVLSGEVFSCILGNEKFETKEEAIEYIVEDITENYNLEDEDISEEDIRGALEEDGVFEWENWSGNTYSYEIEEV